MASWFVLRPTFRLEISVTREVAIERLNLEYERTSDPSQFLMHGEYGELHLPPVEHRFWSPHLSFYISNGEGNTLIHGRFAPRVEIWTTVWILYLAMAFSSFFCFTMAYSQWAISESSWWHWPGILSLIAIIAIYLVAHVGQQWSADQMLQLQSRLHEILDAAEIEQL